MATNVRNRGDASTNVEVALPAAAANSNTPSIDLGTEPRLTVEKVELEVSTDDLPAAFASAATITATIQESDDNVTFAAAVGLSTVVLTGTGAAIAGMNRRVKLQPIVKRYIRVNYALSSGGGALTAYKGRAKLKY